MRSGIQIMPHELHGWVLSVYPDEDEGAVIWLLGEDGQRHRLTEPFKTTFYINGEINHLRAIAKHLQQQKKPPQVALGRRQELYKGLLDVLVIQTDTPIAQEQLFYKMQKAFQNVYYYDAKIPFPIRYGAARGIFPMSKCQVQVNDEQVIQSIHVLDSRWDIEYHLPPLRVLRVEPDMDPHHAPPKVLQLHFGEEHEQIHLDDPGEMLRQLQTRLDHYDPDMILARWGGFMVVSILNYRSRKTSLCFQPQPGQEEKALHYPGDDL